MTGESNVNRLGREGKKVGRGHWAEIPKVGQGHWVEITVGRGHMYLPTVAMLNVILIRQKDMFALEDKQFTMYLKKTK